MKRFILALACGWAAFAQSSPDQVKLSAPPAPPVTVVTAVPVGAGGFSTYYYWVVANYARGAALPASPAVANYAPASLSGGNYVAVSWSAPAIAPTSYDVLRTSAAVFPSGSCTCALATGITGQTVNDTGGALASYTVPAAAPAAVASIYLDSVHYSSAQLRQNVDGVDSQIGSGGSSPNAVLNNQANTYSAGLQDLSATTVKIPQSSGFVASSNSTLGYDTLKWNLHTWAAAVDSIIPPLNTSNPTNGDCLKILNTSGLLQLADFGGPCGGTGSPTGAVNSFGFNNSGSWGSTGTMFSWNPIQSGLVLNVSNPNAANNNTLGAGFYGTCTWSNPNVVLPGFTDQNCFQLNHTVNVGGGQGNYGGNPNYEGKRTFQTVGIQNVYHGSGQKFGLVINQDGRGVSDNVALQMTVVCANKTIAGDENACGFTSQSYATEPPTITTTTVNGAVNRSTCDGYITSTVTRSNVSQVVNFVLLSGACNTNDYVVVSQELPTRAQTEQVAQVTCFNGTGSCGANQIGLILSNSYTPSTVTASIVSGGYGVIMSAANSNVTAGQAVVGTGAPTGARIQSLYFTFTANITNGSNQLTNISDTSGLANASGVQTIGGFGIPANATITYPGSGTTATLSANATQTFTGASFFVTGGNVFMLTSAATATNAAASLNTYFTVTGATSVPITSTQNFAQDGYVVDTSVTHTGTIQAIQGNAMYSSSSTDFSYGMVGGSWPQAGCIALDADTYAGGYGGPGGGGFTSAPLHDWYPITGLVGQQQAYILGSSVVGPAPYSGHGSITTQATTNGTGTLTMTGPNWWQTYPGQYIYATDIPAGTTVSSGSGTQSVSMSGSATGSNYNEVVTIQGGSYTIAPCARLLTLNGNNAVFDSNTFAFSIGDTLEMSIPPDPDREGLQLNWAGYTTGGIQSDITGSNGRSFIHLMNRGARTIPAGIYLHNLMQTNGNAEHLAYGLGFGMPAVYEGMDIGEAQSGIAIRTKVTNSTLGSSHPGYCFWGGPLGTNGCSGLFGDLTTGQLTIETGRLNPTAGGNPVSGSTSVATFPKVSGTVALYADHTDLPANGASINGVIERPSSARDYQLCYQVHTTTAGTAGTALPLFTWQDASGNTLSHYGSLVNLAAASGATTQTVTVGSVTNGSATLTLSGPYSTISNGQFLYMPGVPNGTYVLSGGGTASVTMSANATLTSPAGGSVLTVQGGTMDKACLPVFDGSNGYIQYYVTVTGAAGGALYDLSWYRQRMTY